MIWITILHRDFLKAGVWECWAPVRKIFKSCLIIRILKGKTNVCLRIFQFMLLLLLSRFSRVRLCTTPWTAAYQAPPSMGFSRQQCWSGVPLPSPHNRLESGFSDFPNRKARPTVDKGLGVITQQANR